MEYVSKLQERIEKLRNGRQGFAYILLKLRISKGLTKEKAAAVLGFPLDVYEKWESGKDIPAKGLQTIFKEKLSVLSDAYDEDLPTE